jgi:DNA-binding beta-propeller fold protein YncE
MVQLVLNRKIAWLALVCTVLFGLTPLYASKKPKATPAEAPPELLLNDGRKLVWENSFTSDRDVKNKPGFWTKVLNVIAGEPDHYFMVRPYSVAVDSHGRAIITDPGARGIHIFDFEHHKYKFIARRKEKDGLQSPQCVAVDAEDNIYVTDSEAGKIFVFEPSGKFKRVIGSLKGGEGFFKRPTGIAVDSAAQRIYVTDTLRDQVFVLDMKGDVLQTIGKHGTAAGEFNFPTELRLEGNSLAVVDAMNFRVQVMDLSGNVQHVVGKLGDESGEMFRPKGIGFDSEGHLYVVDGLWGVVQVFNREGQLLYYFGQKGTGFGEFQLPSGLFIDRRDKVFVVDSFNRRVQVFQYYGVAKPVRAGQ